MAKSKKKQSSTVLRSITSPACNPPMSIFFSFRSSRVGTYVFTSHIRLGFQTAVRPHTWSTTLIRKFSTYSSASQGQLEPRNNKREKTETKTNPGDGEHFVGILLQRKKETAFNCPWRREDST